MQTLQHQPLQEVPTEADKVIHELVDVGAAAAATNNQGD